MKALSRKGINFIKMNQRRRRSLEQHLIINVCDQTTKSLLSVYYPHSGFFSSSLDELQQIVKSLPAVPKEATLADYITALSKTGARLDERYWSISERQPELKQLMPTRQQEVDETCGMIAVAQGGSNEQLKQLERNSGLINITLGTDSFLFDAGYGLIDEPNEVDDFIEELSETYQEFQPETIIDIKRHFPNFPKLKFDEIGNLIDFSTRNFGEDQYLAWLDTDTLLFIDA